MYKQKILKTVLESKKLDDDQKLLWDLFLKLSTADENEAVYEAISEKEENLEYLTKYLRDKVWDMKENDVESWNYILKKEAKYAKLLSY